MQGLDRLLRLAASVQAAVPRFYLSGGTAVMFRHRHRRSDDLDFFSETEFSFRRLAARLRRRFRVEGEVEGDDNIDLVIGGIKVSFVFFPFRNVRRVERLGGIRVASDYDIFLNKIYAAGRRIEPKDPIDAAFLLGLHRWRKAAIKADFERKFPDQSFEIFLGALLAFDDYPGLDRRRCLVLETLA